MSGAAPQCHQLGIPLDLNAGTGHKVSVVCGMCNGKNKIQYVELDPISKGLATESVMRHTLASFAFFLS